LGTDSGLCCNRCEVSLSLAITSGSGEREREREREREKERERDEVKACSQTYCLTSQESPLTGLLSHTYTLTHTHTGIRVAHVFLVGILMGHMIHFPSQQENSCKPASLTPDLCVCCTGPPPLKDPGSRPPLSAHLTQQKTCLMTSEWLQGAQVLLVLV